jgi:hypothetical protein
MDNVAGSGCIFIFHYSLSIPFMTPYQIITPLLSLLALAYGWNLALRQKKTIWEAVLWTFFWGGIAAIALYPRILTYLSTLTGIRDQVNAIFVTSIGILFFLCFYIIIRIEELHQRQTRMIRAMALRDADLMRENGD